MNVGAAGDAHEQEADRVADQVVSGQAQRAEDEEALQGSRDPALQRQNGPEEASGPSGTSGASAGSAATGPAAEEEEPLQGSRDPALQRVEDEEPLQGSRDPALQRVEDEEPLQGSLLERAPDAGPVVGMEGGDPGPAVESAVHSAGAGRPLDGAVAGEMGSAMGRDFSDVRVHTGSDAGALNRAIGARAFTTGNHIFFGEGRYNPGTSAGKHLVAHELTHVVQQGAAGPGDGAQRKTVRRKR